jgi:alanine-glyoxylate transaminase/serine-glyoxylate transaminase/serine-pyruvate transaminase
MSRVPGRSFYAAPGPTNVPDSVLQAVAQATTDFMSTSFVPTYEACVAGLRQVLGTETDLHFYAASGHGAWEATLANLFSPNDRILMLETGVFSNFWSSIATGFALEVQTLQADWRQGIDLAALSQALHDDPSHRVQAVCVVHNDTASGVTLPAAEVRACLDEANHPALYLLDVISSAGCLPLELDAWRVDAAIGSTQKGLMMLPGLAFTAVSPRAMHRHRTASLPRAYFDWSRMLSRPHYHSAGTVSSAMFNGLRQSLSLIQSEGLDNVLSRHRRLARAVRAAIAAWGEAGAGQGIQTAAFPLPPAGRAGEGVTTSPHAPHLRPTDSSEAMQLYCRNPGRASDSVSAILLPQGLTATPIRATAADRFNVTLGGDLGLHDDRLFRIGHMGDLNEAMILGVLGAVELSLTANAVPHGNGLSAALRALSGVNANMACSAQPIL